MRVNNWLHETPQFCGNISNKNGNFFQKQRKEKRLQKMNFLKLKINFKRISWNNQYWRNWKAAIIKFGYGIRTISKVLQKLFPELKVFFNHLIFRTMNLKVPHTSGWGKELGTLLCNFRGHSYVNFWNLKHSIT